MTVVRLQFASLLEPKLRAVVNDQSFPRRPVLFPAFFGETIQSKKPTETVFERAGLGDFQVKAEGGAITYTDPIAGVELAHTHVRRSNGYGITQEMLDHEQYGEMLKLERDLQLAGAEDREIAGHLVLNNAFSGSNSLPYGFSGLGFDGLALCSTAHTRLDGGAVQANRPASDVDLGWTALNDAITQFGLWVDHRGRRIRGNPRRLVIYPSDEYIARELLLSSGKPGTPNNEINALQGRGLTFENAIITPYLTDTDSWFVLGDDLTNTTMWYWDVQPRTAMEDDFETETVKRKLVHGFSSGHARWFNVYGSSGA